MSDPPIPMARYAAAPGGQMVFIQPDSRHASRPPALFEYRCDCAPMGTCAYRGAAIQRLLDRLRPVVRELTGAAVDVATGFQRLRDRPVRTRATRG